MTNPVWTPEGWYQDPTGRHEHRYWQGEFWTDAVADGGRMSTDPPTVIPEASVAEAPAVVPEFTQSAETPSMVPEPSEPAADGSPSGPYPSWPAPAPDGFGTPGGPGGFGAPGGFGTPGGPGGFGTPGGPGGFGTPGGPGGPGEFGAPGGFGTPGGPGGPGEFGAPGGFGTPGVPGAPGGFGVAAVPAGVGGRSRQRWILVAAVAGVIVLVAAAAGWFVLSRPGPGPEGLAAAKVSSTSVSLTWSRPKEGPAPQRYVVRRNGVEVARVGATATYQDAGLSPMTSYRYRVLALVEGDLSAPTKDLVVKTRPAAPNGLTSGDVTTTSAVVNWSAPSGVTPDEYIVYRDGTRLATVPAGTLTYKDSSLKPATEVSYTVVVMVEGQESDPSSQLQVTTLPPPAQEARLQDTWDSTLTVTRPGATRLKAGAKSTETWTFSPRCASGPCPVNLTGTVAGKPFTMILTRSGGVYRGVAKAQVAKCVNTAVASTLTLTLQVSAGEMKSGTWAVSNWSGSLDMAIPYTVVGNYYCPNQSATFGVAPDSAAAQPQT